MFDDLMRNAELLTRISKPLALCALGVAALYRGYDTLHGMVDFPAFLLCFLFCASLTALAFCTALGEREEQLD